MKRIRIKRSQGKTLRICMNANPLTGIPVLPNELETITKPWLIRWAEWVAAGKPGIEEQQTANKLCVLRGNDWNPALHPRDPETGKFVERPFNIPDGVDTSGLSDMSTGEILSEISEAGEDVESVLQADEISINGIPNDATNLDDIDIAQSFDEVASPTEARDLAINRIEDVVEDTSVSLENMDEGQARTLTESVERLAEENPEFFSAVEEIRDHDLNATASAAYDPGQNALVFGPSSMSGNEAYEGYLARNSGPGTVAHEVGHAAHYGDSGEDIFDYYFWPEGVTQEEIDQIESEVSEYAAESPEEFVAEAFSVLADGGELSERTREIYDKLNGPAINP